MHIKRVQSNKMMLMGKYKYIITPPSIIDVQRPLNVQGHLSKCTLLLCYLIKKNGKGN